MSRLKQSHPRLLLANTTAADIKASLKENDEKRLAFGEIVKKAQKILDEPVVQYKSGDMLAISRTVLKRVVILAFLFRASGNKQYLERAVREMLAASAFPDWHTEHFLDTAEMMDALAIGYDWLYDALSPAERATIKNAIATKGIAEGAAAYDQKKFFWVKEVDTNWNTVCNGSILMASLALAGKDDDCAPAREMVGRSFEHFYQGLGHYAPDGALDEGPTYWHYSTAYMARTLACLESSGVAEAKAIDAPGLSKTGDFALAMTGPTGELFNFADSGPHLDAAPELFWLAGRYDRPILAWKERDLLNANRSNASVWDLLWWNKSGSADDLCSLPAAQAYGGMSPVVSMRASWTDPLAAYVGFLGGANISHHSHLGMGNFVFDLNGVRWASLLGPDNYDMPGFFDVSAGDTSPRWRYYRNNSLGQNVMLFGGTNQSYQAEARPVDTCTDSASPHNFAIMDLSPAYLSVGLNSFLRGVCLFKDKSALVVQDEFSRGKAADAVWQMNTRAKVQILNEHEALLSIGTRKLLMTLLCPRIGRFEEQPVVIPEPQNQISGMTKVTVHFGSRVPGDTTTINAIAAGDEKKARSTDRVCVLFTPYFEPAGRRANLLKVIPLADWKNSLSAKIWHE